MEHLINVIAVIVGLSLGATAPDIDLAPPLPVRHRSAWTHGPLLPVAVMWLAGLGGAWFWFGAGFLPALALHLVKDMFPKKWHGGAKISWYPLGKWRMNGGLSFLFLGEPSQLS